MEIEPDGQQFLNAKAAADAEAGEAQSPRPAPPAPPSGGGSRTTVVVVALVVAVLVAGGVAFATLTGDTDGRRELETGGDSEIELRERAAASTTTEPPPETTTTAAPTTTTAPPTDNSQVPFPDFGQVQPGVQPGLPPAGAVCPSGGISMVVGTSSFTSVNGNSAKRIEIQGTATNDTTAPVILELTLTIDHDANNHPTPWTTPVVQSTPTLAPGATSQWTFDAVFAGANYANVSALGGGFRWADPANASCPTQ